MRSAVRVIMNKNFFSMFCLLAYLNLVSSGSIAPIHSMHVEAARAHTNPSPARLNFSAPEKMLVFTVERLLPYLRSNQVKLFRLPNKREEAIEDGSFVFLITWLTAWA